MHEPAVCDQRGVADIVANQPAPGQHSAAQVEFLAILEYLDGFAAEPRPVPRCEGQKEPVGRIH